MARRYTAMTRGQRIGNAVVALLVRIGLGPKDTYLLTVPGRRTGKPYTTPVTLVQTGEGRWLVAPYGAVSWVRNARAAGRVTLRRGNRTEEAAVTEVDARALDGRSDSRQLPRLDRHRLVEHDGVRRLLR